MRILFLGTPQFAVPSLKALLDASGSDLPIEVVGVVTQPDREAGRGQKMGSPPIKLLARDFGLDVFQPARIRNNPEAFEYLQATQPDLMVVVAFGQILPADFFSYPVHGTLNVHASLLPLYRGAAPIAHAILNGETITGVTIMKIDEGMDTGDILTQSSAPIPEEMTAGELEAVLAAEGARLLVRTLPGYLRGEISPRPQLHEAASYAPRLKKEDAGIDWTLTAVAVHNRVRAFNPWPAAVTRWSGKELKVWSSAKVDETSRGPLPGTVVEAAGEQIKVQCGSDTLLALRELQLPSRGRVSARDFINGTHLRAGDRFE